MEGPASRPLTPPTRHLDRRRKAPQWRDPRICLTAERSDALVHNEGVTTLEQTFGNLDIYLFDQLLRGNIAPGMRLLDAGCGSGRNLIYLLREHYDVSAIDASPDAVDHVRSLATCLAPHLPPENLRCEAIESLSFPDASFDGVLCNSVLHFARSTAHFHAMLAQLWRVLRPGGLLFCRLASTIGMRFEPVAGDPASRLFQLPHDGPIWYLVDASLLLDLTASLGATLVDPLKTTVVQDSRCMTTWVLRKPLLR